MTPENTPKSDLHPDSNTPVYAIFSFGAITGALAALVLSLFRRRQVVARQDRVSTLAASPTAEGVTTAQAGQEVSLADLPKATSVTTAQASISPTPPATQKAGLELTASPGWSTPTRYIMGVVLFLAALLVLFIGRAVIPMVIAAGLLALLTNPVIAFWMRRLRMRKGLAVGLTYALVLAVLLAIPFLGIPPLLDAVNFFLSINPQELAQGLAQGIRNAAVGIQGSPGLAIILGPFLESLVVMLDNFAAAPQLAVPTAGISITDVSSGLGQAFGALAKVLGPTISVAASLLLTLVISLQMALSAERLSAWYAELIPPGHGPELARLSQEIRGIWTGFLRGQMTLMIIIGLITWLGNTILGLPQALFLGVIAGFMELIPNIGPTLAAVPAVVIALIFGSSHLAISNLVFALIVVAFYVGVQMLENQFVVPHVMGEAVDLPPLVVLIGTIAGASAFGILGALLATPFIATGNLLFRYVYRKILEQPPAPAPLEEKPSLSDSIKGFFSRLRNPKA